MSETVPGTSQTTGSSRCGPGPCGPPSRWSPTPVTKQGLKKRVLMDTGPLVASLNRRDRFHLWAKARLSELEPPISTCEPVLAEACFLLRLKARRGTVNRRAAALLLPAWPRPLSQSLQQPGRAAGAHSRVSRQNHATIPALRWLLLDRLHAQAHGPETAGPREAGARRPVAVGIGQTATVPLSPPAALADSVIVGQPKTRNVCGFSRARSLSNFAIMPGFTHMRGAD